MQTSTIEYKKDASITFKNEKGESVEYRIFNIPIGDLWFICVCYFEGADIFELHKFAPTVEDGEEFEMKEIILTTSSGRKVAVKYPSQANMRVIDFRCKMC